MASEDWEAKLDAMVRNSGIPIEYDARPGHERYSRGVSHMSPKPRDAEAKAEWAGASRLARTPDLGRLQQGGEVGVAQAVALAEHLAVAASAPVDGERLWRLQRGHLLPVAEGRGSRRGITTQLPRRCCDCGSRCRRRQSVR